MALLDLRKYKFNNYKNRVESVIMTVNTQVDREVGFALLNPDGSLKNNTRRDIVVGDTLIIGEIPKYSYVTDIRVLYFEAFDDTTTFDIGFIGDFPEETVVPFATFVGDLQNLSQYIPLSINGVADKDGVQVPVLEADYRGGIWNDGVEPMKIGLKVHNETILEANPLTTGKCKILVSFIRYSEDDVIRGEVVAP